MGAMRRMVGIMCVWRFFGRFCGLPSSLTGQPSSKGRKVEGTGPDKSPDDRSGRVDRLS